MVHEAFTSIMNRNRLFSEVTKTFYFIFLKKVAEYGRFTVPSASATTTTHASCFGGWCEGWDGNKKNTKKLP